MTTILNSTRSDTLRCEYIKNFIKTSWNKVMKKVTKTQIETLICYFAGYFTVLFGDGVFCS